MKLTILTIICVFAIVCCKENSRDEQGSEVSREKLQNECRDDFDFAGPIKAIITEKSEGAVLFRKLHDAGYDSIKVASNFEYESSTISFENRTAYFVPDTNIRMPLIVLAVSKNCNFANFEFGTNRFTITGSVEKRDEIWKAKIKDVVEIN